MNPPTTQTPQQLAIFKRPQWEVIWEHLKVHGSITPLECQKLYGFMRLADIIFKLKKRINTETEEIVTKEETAMSRHNVKVHFAKYVYIKKSPLNKEIEC